VHHIGTTSPAHEVERALGTALRSDIEAVAAWQPPPWRPAFLWLRALIELPVAHHLLTGRPATEWMAGLPLSGGAAERTAEARQQALARSPLGPLLPARDDAPGLLEGWVRQWHRLLPPVPSAYAPALRELESALRRYRSQVASGEAEPDAGLETALTRLFRRHAREPAAAYAHMGLLALDLQRLRAGLLRRRLFAGGAA
jgi:hypothetical protein